MENSLKEKIDDFIKNWYWDENSKPKAFEIGKVCFTFIQFLEEKLSPKTIRIHTENLFWIGIFENQYGLNEAFDKC